MGASLPRTSGRAEVAKLANFPNARVSVRETLGKKARPQAVSPPVIREEQVGRIRALCLAQPAPLVAEGAHVAIVHAVGDSWSCRDVF